MPSGYYLQSFITLIMNQDLFGEPLQINTSLVIKPISKKLSQTEKNFNRLLSKVDKLKLELEQEKERLDKTLETYLKEIPPVQRLLAPECLRLAQILNYATDRLQLNKGRLEQASDAIIFFCLEVLHSDNNNEEAKQLHDKWSQVSLAEMADIQKAHDKNMFEEMMHEEFGVDLDFSDVEIENESFDSFREKVESKIEEEFANKKGKGKNKQKKKDQERKMWDQVKQKSIRQIYISLAKLMHPDMAPDKETEHLNGELMKKITTAYHDNDLLTLLQLEMEIIGRDTGKQLDDSTLKIYVSCLKEQVMALEQQIAMLYHSPRFADIENYIFANPVWVKDCIAERVAELNLILANLQKQREQLNDGNSRKAVNALLSKITRVSKFSLDFFEDDLLAEIFLEDTEL